ncbi:Venom serine protease Bi-VSP [Amphibalanus amphitrite]|uniref:CLIP domain-containing serine protease n=1 Tax=Amphibalanus amphitrite TaxID=1232801 RepID=A0A6A4XEC8_AMPAM|nr:Venom serine protease Bi-VSP [Amphibalanus amphitrite]
MRVGWLTVTTLGTMDRTRRIAALLLLAAVGASATFELPQYDPVLGDVFPVLVEARSSSFHRDCHQKAECVPISSCPKLYELLSLPTIQSVRRLKASTCRIVDRKPFVCCYKNDILPSPEQPPSTEDETGTPKTDTRQEQPPAEPEQPAAETEQPPAEPEQPAVEPEQPPAEPQQPAAEPEQLPAEPASTPAEAVGTAVAPAEAPADPVPEPAEAPANASLAAEEGELVARFFSSSDPSQEVHEELDYLDEHEEFHECGFGRLATRIFGGVEAIPHSWPWIAVLGYGFVPEDVYWACGATLVGPRHVVTAAHCVTEETADGLQVVTDLQRVRLGEHDLFNDNDGPVMDAIPERIIVHDNYTGRPEYSNDIALIRLDRRVNYTENISPVCLPGVLRPPVEIPSEDQPAAAVTPNAEENEFIVSGWGSDGKFVRNVNKKFVRYEPDNTGVRHGTDRLREVTVTQVNGTVCRQHFGRFGIPVRDTIQLCAGGQGVDSCSGDSGGPLIQDTGMQYELVGVVSLGGVICGGQIPGLYTRVQAYTEWMAAIMAEV